ncbi:MAG: hypothetical protein P0Y53_08810 [Candidatus Pseudobacter hemicellulosilyticus]|uniref:BZIP transcription factor n=1 Tax=Candidatus Pseudobacter hemicellulosilyticus TaxID=3121375 RepID=A0AAJ5WSU8_9BACT|nr:MAG: hypothetical protein P0Y53_08810 [Pseudobacter sp.]
MKVVFPLFLLFFFMMPKTQYAQQWQYGTGTAFFTGGNVGIGTSTPLSLLHVNGRLTMGTNSGGYNLILNDIATAKWAIGTGSYAFRVASDYPAEWTDRFVISNLGKVGIGTSNPNELLDVAGTVKAVRLLAPDLTYNTGDEFTFNGRTAGHYSLSWGADDWSTPPTAWLCSYGGMRFFTAGHLKMSLDINGNLGLGTAAPAYRFDIDAPDNDRGTRIRLANTTTSGPGAPGSFPAIEVLGARGDGNRTFHGRLALGVRNTGGTGLTDQTLGAVLFGGQYGTDMTFQSGKLLYPASIQGVAEGSFTTAGNMPTGIVFSTGTVGDDVGSANLAYGTERMRITNTGNVGIGTTFPQAKLAVNGDVFAKKVKVTATGWPDYVFQPNYFLRPLIELEQFIREHKHLPEVPSAEEVTKEGLNLGDNQALLLQKIEELTLYLIEQNKRLEKQENEIKRLKEQLEQKN